MTISRRGFLARGAAAACCGLGAAAAASGAEADDDSGAAKGERSFMLYPVGTVQNKLGKPALLQILPKYQPALKGLEDFSHVIVLYWFDKNDTPQKRGILQVHPRGDRENPLTGVFACRAPVRPNLIALSVCKVLAVQNGTVRVDKIDAFDGTPILDLKPHVPAIDAPKDVRLPKWLAR